MSAEVTRVDKAKSASAVEALFGWKAHYPATKPQKIEQMKQRRWRVWHRFTVAWLLLPAWLALVLAPISTLTGNSDLWAIEVAGVILWLVGSAAAADSRSMNAQGAHNHSYLPAFWRRWHGVTRDPFSDDELTVLEAVWSLGTTIKRLEPARARLAAQISDSDKKRIAGFSGHAREALARGDRTLAKALLEAQGQAVEHHAWVEEQLARLDHQLNLLRDKQYHLKTRLALHHMRQTAVAAQVEANEIRAEMLELVSDYPLDLGSELDLSSGELLDLTDAALDAEARVLALEELGQALPEPSVDLSGPELDHAFAALKLEVGLSSSAR